MKRSAMSWAVVGLLAVAAVAGAGEKSKSAGVVDAKEVKALAIGASAPKADVKMANVDGKSLSIAEVKGENGTLVIFTCNTCPWAQAWEGRIAEIGNEYAKQKVGVIAINSNDPSIKPEDGLEAMKTRAETLKLAFPYVVDASSDVARAFGATRTPEVFLFDGKGKLVYHGAVDDNAREPEKVTERWLQAALAATVEGKPVAVKETKSMGCSIKFRGKSTAS
ncbi:MAG TPA: thioredoxin family protein [Candidatus Eisenbacteria bacterium]|nr:thioredoxin family protein [Candidatus Eisenbacteria bacterium]